jgi:hypothetical protein
MKDYWWIAIAWIPSLAMLVYSLLLMRRAKERERIRRLMDNPDPDLVLAQRKLYADGEFRRRVLRRTPHDLNTDLIDLECGHSVWRSNYRADEDSVEPGAVLDCYQCASDFLKIAVTRDP